MSRWLNTTTPMWKNALKPCKACGFCPYGQLVEEFPLPSITRKEAKAHIAGLKQRLKQGVFKEENKVDGLPLMTEDDVRQEIAEFNPEDYPVQSEKILEHMACQVFGHCCPVFFHAEPFAEDKPATEEEVDLFVKEIDESGWRK